MGFVERRDTSRWRARYRAADGRERSRTFGRKGDADRWLRSQEQAVSDGTWTDPGRGAITVTTWLEQWLPARRGDLRPTTLERLSSVCRCQIEPKWGSRRLSSIGNAEVQAWAADLQSEGLSSRSARKAVMAFRQVMAAALADRRLSVNPVDGVQLPADSGADRPWMSQVQAHALLDVIEPRYRVAVLLGFFCGLRFGEATALQRDDVDVLRSRITVRRTASVVGGKVIVGPPKTRAGRRVLPVSRHVMKEIERHLAEHVGPQADALVMSNSTGGPVLRQNFLRRVWQPALHAAGLPAGLSPHSMRHGYASWLIAAGFSVKEVSVWSGHSSVSTTMSVYAHVGELQDDDAADRLDKALTLPGPAGDVRSLRRA